MSKGVHGRSAFPGILMWHEIFLWQHGLFSEHLKFRFGSELGTDFPMKHNIAAMTVELQVPRLVPIGSKNKSTSICISNVDVCEYEFLLLYLQGVFHFSHPIFVSMASSFNRKYHSKLLFFANGYKLTQK